MLKELLLQEKKLGKLTFHQDEPEEDDITW